MRNENLEPFVPGSTVSLAVTTSSARVALPNADGKVKQQVRIYNAGSGLAFIRIDDVNGVALVTDMPIPPDMVEVLTLAPTQTPRYLCAITASGTATLYATPGAGV